MHISAPLAGRRNPDHWLHGDESRECPIHCSLAGCEQTSAARPIAGYRLPQP